MKENEPEIRPYIGGNPIQFARLGLSNQEIAKERHAKFIIAHRREYGLLKDFKGKRGIILRRNFLPIPFLKGTIPMSVLLKHKPKISKSKIWKRSS